jgi:hypothetical protein
VAVNHPPDGYAGSIPVSPTKPLPHDWIERGSSKNPRVILVSGVDRKALTKRKEPTMRKIVRITILSCALVLFFPWPASANHEWDHAGRVVHPASCVATAGGVCPL